VRADEAIEWYRADTLNPSPCRELSLPIRDR
jgi:hypothetical protein